MSGISTNAKHAILNTTRGLNLDTYRTATELAEQAMRNVMWELSPEEHVAWAERMVQMIREHREVPAGLDAADAARWRVLCRNFGNERDESTPGKPHAIVIRLNPDGCEVVNPDGSLNFAATLAAIMDDEVRIQARASSADVSGVAVDARTCTCHPDDNPPRPCPRKFALSECRAAARPADQG